MTTRHEQHQSQPAPARVPAAKAAAIIGVSVRTLDRYQKAGIITPLAVPRSPRYFRVADIEKLTEPAVNAS